VHGGRAEKHTISYYTAHGQEKNEKKWNKKKERKLNYINGFFSVAHCSTHAIAVVV
jgi:hypothetical protein